jgi:ATP phosphoribosyltransferase regulatory subunit
MTVEPARQFEALEAQARNLTAVFTSAGYELVAPALIQPAGLFLDVVGETLRARTYVFTDLDGAELCLRPDLTVPTCRLHLARHPDARGRAGYCYNGPAFRFQPTGADAAHPREFRQAGLELFGEADREAADAEVLALSLAALKAAGLEAYGLRIGDVALFRALTAVLPLPDRWRRRLRVLFWQPEAFRAELKRLSTDPGAAARLLPMEVAGCIVADDPAATEQRLAAHLAHSGIEAVGTRSLGEVAERLVGHVLDAGCPPLPPATRELIEGLLAIRGPARQAGEALERLARAHRMDLDAALAVYHARLDRLARAGVAVDAAEFSAEFGRGIEYYTGFVYEVVSPALGAGSPVAGGGRYDRLMKVIGAPRNVPAVGGMVHTERLLSIVAAARGRGAGQ